MRANGNNNEASVERFYSVRINRMMSPSDAVNLESLLAITYFYGHIF